MCGALEKLEFTSDISFKRNVERFYIYLYKDKKCINIFIYECIKSIYESTVT